MALDVERIDHIHILVRDLNSAIKFFSDLLGTTFSPPIPSEEAKAVGVVCPLGIELVAPAGTDSPLQRLLERRGEGLIGIALKVPDMEAAHKELAQRGIRQTGIAHLGRIVEVQFHPKDTYGAALELCEYDDRHAAALAALGVDFGVPTGKV